MKVHRLLSIVMQLLTRKRIGAQELSELFEVSLRTIYRDLDTISSAGIPIVSYSGPNGGYEIMEPYHIDRQMVTLEDLNAIITALKGLQASLNDREIADLIVKVNTLVAKSEQAKQEEAGDTLLFNTPPWRNVQNDAALVGELRQAARNRNVVRFDYVNAEGATEARIVEPIGLAWKGYAWYVYAYCRLRGDYRTFRLSRIKSLQVEAERFAPRDISLEELDARWGTQTTANIIRVTLRFHPRTRAKVEEFFQPEEIEVMEDGYFIITTLFPEDSWLYGTLLGYGTDVTVLEPEHLAGIIRDKALQIARKYEAEG